MTTVLLKTPNMLHQWRVGLMVKRNVYRRKVVRSRERNFCVMAHQLKTLRTLDQHSAAKNCENWNKSNNHIQENVSSFGRSPTSGVMLFRKIIFTWLISHFFQIIYTKRTCTSVAMTRAPNVASLV